MTELTTERLLLRDFVLTDEAAVHAFASNPNVTRYTDWGPNRPDETRSFVMAASIQPAQTPPRSAYTLAVVARQAGRLIGSVGLEGLWEDGRSPRLGYVFHPDCWGQGLATEAAGRVLAFGTDELGLVRVEATCRPDNVASAAVLEKIGMRLDGRLARDVLVRGEWQDSLLYSVGSRG